MVTTSEPIRSARSTTVAEPAGQVAMVFSGDLASSTAMPGFITADETYYWSFRWQSDVREAMAALAAGDYEDFDSGDPSDVARWLLSVDSDGG